MPKLGKIPKGLDTSGHCVLSNQKVSKGYSSKLYALTRRKFIKDARETENKVHQSNISLCNTGLYGRVAQRKQLLKMKACLDSRVCQKS